MIEIQQYVEADRRMRRRINRRRRSLGQLEQQRAEELKTLQKLLSAGEKVDDAWEALALLTSSAANLRRLADRVKGKKGELFLLLEHGSQQTRWGGPGTDPQAVPATGFVVGELQGEHVEINFKHLSIVLPVSKTVLVGAWNGFSRYRDPSRFRHKNLTTGVEIHFIEGQGFVHGVAAFFTSLSGIPDAGELRLEIKIGDDEVRHQFEENKDMERFREIVSALDFEKLSASS